MERKGQPGETNFKNPAVVPGTVKASVAFDETCSARRSASVRHRLEEGSTSGGRSLWNIDEVNLSDSGT